MIPLTSNLGIIEFIENTNVLKNLFRSSVEDIGIFDDCSKLYVTWLKKTLPRSVNENVYDLYKYSLLKRTKNETISNYNSLVNKIPWDVLRFEDISILFKIKYLTNYGFL